MCFVDAAISNLEIDQDDLEQVCYKCLDCGSTFKMIDERIKYPICESTRIWKV